MYKSPPPLLSIPQVPWICCCLVAKSCPTLCDPMDCCRPGFPVLHHLLKLAQAHVHWVCDAIQSSCPLSSPSSPAFPSFRVFSSELVLCITWPKYRSFSISEYSNEYSRLISFRIDWFDLLAFPGILKSLLQHHGSKVWILWCSVFFIVQLSHLYMTTGKAIALTIQTFVGKIMSLFFNMLSWWLRW